jgi:hypothetical protein
MYDAFLDQCEESIADLFEKFYGLCFWYFFFLFYIFLEIAVTELLDDVVVIVAFHDIHDTHHVLGFK